jgi:hypothetical protein
MDHAGLCQWKIVRLGFLAMALLGVGCDDPDSVVLRGCQKSPPPSPRAAPPPIVETAEQALKRTQKEECAKLAAQPDTFLDTSGIKYHDKGIINDYREFVGVTVLNKARYCSIRSAQGDVTWLDAQGAKLGSTPFALKVSIPAGATQKFSTEDGTLTSGTLQGAGVTVTIHFTGVEIVQPP